MLETVPRPTHPIYEHTDTLAVNPVAFILAIALADGAFRDYATLDEILAIEPPSDEAIWQVEWKESILDTPFCRAITSRGLSSNIQTANSFGDQLARLGKRSGHERNITIHAVRREALIKADGDALSPAIFVHALIDAADNGYSEAERMKFAGHLNPSTFPAFYMAPLSTVDGQGSFLGQRLRRDFIEDFRGMALSRNSQLWQSLPAKLQYDLECRPDFMALDKEIAAISERIKLVGHEDNCQDLRARRRDLYVQRRGLTLAELKASQKGQPRRLTAVATTDAPVEDYHRIFFTRVRRLIPERDRLATSLFLPITLRSAEGRAAVQDLVALCAQDRQVAYHPSLRPHTDRCPLPTCATELGRSVMPCD